MQSISCKQVRSDNTSSASRIRLAIGIRQSRPFPRLPPSSSEYRPERPVRGRRSRYPNSRKIERLRPASRVARADPREEVQAAQQESGDVAQVNRYGRVPCCARPRDAGAPLRCSRAARSANRTSLFDVNLRLDAKVLSPERRVNSVTGDCETGVGQWGIAAHSGIFSIDSHGSCRCSVDIFELHVPIVVPLQIFSGANPIFLLETMNHVPELRTAVPKHLGGELRVIGAGSEVHHIAVQILRHIYLNGCTFANRERFQSGGVAIEPSGSMSPGLAAKIAGMSSAENLGSFGRSNAA